MHNFIDILLAIPLLWGLYRGFSKGIVLQAISLALIILMIYGVMAFSFGYFDSEATHCTLFFILVLFFLFWIHALVRWSERYFLKEKLKFSDEFFGAVLGLIRWGLITSAILVVFHQTARRNGWYSERSYDRIEQSRLYMPLLEVAPFIYTDLNFNQRIIEQIEKASVLVRRDTLLVESALENLREANQRIEWETNDKASIKKPHLTIIEAYARDEVTGNINLTLRFLYNSRTKGIRLQKIEAEDPGWVALLMTPRTNKQLFDF